MKNECVVLKQASQEQEVNACPNVDWYKFKGKCTITTCKNCNQFSPRGCLALDRVEPVGAKFISDAELRLYFFPPKTSARIVSWKRKRSVDNIKTLLVLNRYLNFIRANYKASRPIQLCDRAKSLQVKYPLRINRLNFAFWMWEFILQPTVFEAFKLTLDGESKEFGLSQLLNLTELKFDALCAEQEKIDNEHCHCNT